MKILPPNIAIYPIFFKNIHNPLSIRYMKKFCLFTHF